MPVRKQPPSAQPASGWAIADVASGVGAAAPSAEVSRALGAWLDTLTEWNTKIDLTAAKDARALVWLMLADAMVLAKALPQSEATSRTFEVLDVGTGAGAPGLALAILRPDLHVTLCEPLGKRAAFLRTVIGTLGRTDITLEPKRAQQLERNAFDVAISRATFSPEAWLATGAELVRAGGSVWVLLAQDAAPAHASCSIAETVSYVDASTGAAKRLVRYVVAAPRSEGGGA